MTRRRWFGRLVAFLLMAVGLAGPLWAGPWKVGTAVAKITPQEPQWLAGYAGRNHPSEGATHDLWIEVLVLEDAAGAVGVVLSSDLLGFSPQLYERLVEAIQNRCGVDRAHLMLTASHTHCSPVLHDALPDIYPLDDVQRRRIEQYTAWLEGTIVETIAKALAERSEATLWTGHGEATFAVNRRKNPEGQVPALREKNQLAGPVDHDVPVLAVRRPDGSLRAVLFGYACHATTLDSYTWSGDYPGYAKLALGKSHPGAVALFFQGCGADQNPLPRRQVALCEQYGRRLAEAVDRVLAGSMRPLAPRLRTDFELIALPYGTTPSRQELQSAAKSTDYRGRWARRLLGRLEAGETLETQCPYPVQVWRLGEDQLWIALGGEVVVDYALLFKRLFGPTTWIAGYTNSVPAYIPSDRVWKEGGYEAGAFEVYGAPTTRWAPGIEQQITDAVSRLVEKTK